MIHSRKVAAASLLTLLVSVGLSNLAPVFKSSSQHMPNSGRTNQSNVRPKLSGIDGSGVRKNLNSSTSGNFLLPPASSGSSSTLNVQVTAIHIDKAEFPLSKVLFRLTLELALEELEKKLKNKRLKLALNVRSASTCSHQYAAAVAAEEYYTRKSRLFIVSGCDDAIRGVARLASDWQVPVMTAAGFAADLNDKTIYRTLVRVAFSMKTAVEFLVRILRSFQWRRVNLIVDESDPNSLALREGIEKNLLEFNYSDYTAQLNPIVLDLKTLYGSQSQDSGNSTGVPHDNSLANALMHHSSESDDKWPNNLTEKAVHDVIKLGSIYSRVSILLIPQQYLRKFMLSVYDSNMANGQYTYINMPLILTTSDDQVDNSVTSKNKNFVKQSFTSSTGDNVFIWRSLTSSRNAHAKQAFESLMSIYLKAPTSKAYMLFAGKLLDLANVEFATTTMSSLGHDKSSTDLVHQTSVPQSKTQLSINAYTASFYDCLQIYAMALDESLSLIEKETNKTTRRKLKGQAHAKVSDLLRSRRIDNMVTGTILMNENGDRETDYTLDDMNQMTGKYRPVMIFKGENREMERLSRIQWSSDESVGATIDTVECHISGTCPSKPMSRFLITIISLSVPMIVVLGVIVFFVYRRISFESQLVDYWWKINYKDVEIISTRRKDAADGQKDASTVVGSQVSSRARNARQANDDDDDRTTKDTLQPTSEIGKTTITKVTSTSAFNSSIGDVCYGDISLGIYKLAKVAIKPILKFNQSRKMMMELRLLKSASHNNLCRFVGIITEEPHTALVSEFCPKGSLREFFQNESMVIDWTFKYSIINDIMAGLLYIHSSPIEFHGRLKSTNCLVSSRFVVKLSDYGLSSLHEQLDSSEDEYMRFAKQVWLAPEHIKSGSKHGSKKGDVYSFGLLLYEIITNKLPFYDAEKKDYHIPLKTLIAELKSNGVNDKVGLDLELSDASENIEPLVTLMKQCLTFDINKRPSPLVVQTALKKITHGVTSSKLLENLTSRMEQYTTNLESIVDSKLADLVEEKKRTEELLYQFVPKSLASILKQGEMVEPEAYDCVTVFFSDIVGFTSLSSESTPMQVVGFLSEIYQCFDETLEHYDIFKVETIGDAYIVASGLPEKNEDKHVLEIACAALKLREKLTNFKIPHKKDRKLEMRVGIHSGPCIAGVVGGLSMPKYCIFGETLMMGKFMECSGQPMKLHITEESKNLLERFGGFKIEPRTPKAIKDGLPIQTYWMEKD